MQPTSTKRWGPATASSVSAESSPQTSRHGPRCPQRAFELSDRVRHLLLSDGLYVERLKVGHVRRHSGEVRDNYGPLMPNLQRIRDRLGSLRFEGAARPSQN